MQNKHKIIFMTLSISIFVFLTSAIIMMSLLIANEVSDVFGTSTSYTTQIPNSIYPGLTNWQSITTYDFVPNEAFNDVAIPLTVVLFVLTAIAWTLIIVFHKFKGMMLPIANESKHFNFDAVLYFAPFFSWIFYLSFKPKNVKVKALPKDGYISGREKRVQLEDDLILGNISPEEFEVQMKDFK